MSRVRTQKSWRTRAGQCAPVAADSMLHRVITTERSLGRFDVDLESQMLGELKPYGRQVSREPRPGVQHGSGC